MARFLCEGHCILMTVTTKGVNINKHAFTVQSFSLLQGTSVTPHCQRAHIHKMSGQSMCARINYAKSLKGNILTYTQYLSAGKCFTSLPSTMCFQPGIAQSQVRLYSDDTTDDSQGTRPEEIRMLPRRLIKRLKNQGISETDFLIKMNNMRQAYERATNDQSIWPKDLGTQSKQSQEFQTFDGSKSDLESLLKGMSTTNPTLNTDSDDFPSDMERTHRLERIAKRESMPPSKPKIAPSGKSIILFPGQGSQFVGMGQKLLPFPGVKELFDEASSILGYDLLHMCLEGPKSELDKTVHCQPAVLITSLAAIERLREEHPKAVENCVATAGFSVGEFAALVFSGVISFPDAVKVVQVRAEAMQRASEAVGSGMLTVFLAHDSDLKGAMRMAREYCQSRRDIPDPVCTVANYLFPECKVLAGHQEALEFISANAKEFRLLRTKRLPVSGAFHTQLMASACQPLVDAFNNIKLGRPKIEVYSNVTSNTYHPYSKFPHLLSKQVTQPVKWEQILHGMYKRPQGSEFPATYEVGPGRQMGTLLKQVNLQAHKRYHNIEV